METFAIISDYHQNGNDNKDFHIILENLTKEQVISLKNTIPLFKEKLYTSHLVGIKLEIEGFDQAIYGYKFDEIMRHGKVIPMCSLENFK